MVDIIIPLYNAFSYFKDCLESVLRQTRVKHRIIVINDKSDEKKLLDYLEKLKKSNIPNLVILKNKKNLGFVKTVNRGMQYSKINDVVLLNSDTVVTKNWLEKIQECAYSSEAIATVTPLSNSATICSVPDFGKDNELPKGYTIDSFAQLIEDKSLKLYPEIPTAVGFCMYIKRESLNLLGYFDEKNFAKGYGEENDFSMKVKKAGLLNVLDDTTFIYHKGSASFTDERKTEIQRKSLKTIEKLHPGYLALVDRFCKENPLSPIHKNIKFWINSYSPKKKNILFVKQYEPGPGGVGYLILDIIKNVSDLNYYVLSPTKENNIQLDLWRNRRKTGSLLFSLKNKDKDKSITDIEIEDLFKFILSSFKIDLVHFQHLLGLPLSLLSIPRKKNIPSLITLHDFFIINSSIFLQREPQSKNVFSFYKNSTEYLEDIKGKRTISSKANYELTRLKYIKEKIKNINTLIVPSEFLRSEFKNIFVTSDIKIIPHGLNIPKSRDTIPIRSKTITISFLGVAAPHKGITEFLRIVAAPKLRGKFHWKIIGPINDYLELLKDLGFSNTLKKVEIIGRFNREKLPQIFRREKVDIVILTSTCPESYSFTLSESIQCNIPVVGRNLGAIGDRIKRGKFGWTYNTFQEAISTLENLYEQPGLIEEKKEYLKRIRIPSTQETTTKYRKLYKEIIKKKRTLKKKTMKNYMLPSKNKYILEHIVFEQEVPKFPKRRNSLKSYLRESLRKIPLINALATKTYRLYKQMT